MKIDIIERKVANNGRIIKDGYIVECRESYSVKDALKANGYRFDGVYHKAWYKQVATEAEAVEEIANLFINRIATPEDSYYLYEAGTLNEDRNFTAEQGEAMRAAFGM